MEAWLTPADTPTLLPYFLLLSSSSSSSSPHSCDHDTQQTIPHCSPPEPHPDTAYGIQKEHPTRYHRHLTHKNPAPPTTDTTTHTTTTHTTTHQHCYSPSGKPISRMAPHGHPCPSPQHHQVLRRNHPCIATAARNVPTHSGAIHYHPTPPPPCRCNHTSHC
jgi:hypothetical protein